MKKSGLAIHCHHEMLIEYCYDYDERVRYIKENKPISEQKTRLRLFKLLPDEAIKELPIVLVKVYAELGKACAEWDKADAALDKADAEWKKADAARDKADAKWNKADAARDKADAKWNKACASWKKEDREAWHKKWCGCKEWNEKEIKL